jgi:hypothetical protein
MVADEIALPLLQQMGYGPDIQMFAKYHDLVREIVGKNGVLALGLVALAVKTKHLAVAWRDEFRKRRS